MCGIICCLKYSEDSAQQNCPACYPNQEFLQLNEILRNRGPDISSEQCFKILQNKSSISCHLTGHVLWTRGEKPERQPYCDPDNPERFGLLYNGDIYSFTAGENSASNSFAGRENDGLRLFDLFQSASSVQEMLETIGNLRGPYAFIFLDTIQRKLWFGRDFFGRESLILSFDQNSNIYLSSISTFNCIFEVPTSGIFCLDIRERKTILYPWNSHDRQQILELTQEFSELLEVNGFEFSNHEETRIPIFSSRLASPNINSGILKQLEEIPELDSPEIQLEKVSEILGEQIEGFLFHLRNSVRDRVLLKPPVCKNCSQIEIETCTHSKISVLFSGGLDSTVLAFLAAEILTPGESMDLLNVAFFQDGKEPVDSLIPDRQTGLESYKVLKKIFEPKGVKLNFIPVNVYKSTVAEMREKRIRHLVSPLKSVLDDSLGCCLWFAAASGNLEISSKSSARIVLLGSGADELLGGYGRHRSAFERGGWEELGKEMQLEIDRISVRNMGRDNRIVSDHGVAPRIPFLDEKLVTFLTECDVWVKCCPIGFGRGLGEKILLRAAALKLFGIENFRIALFPKRAMQFGSRIAKLENSKEKGGDECKRLFIQSNKTD